MKAPFFIVLSRQRAVIPTKKSVYGSRNTAAGGAYPFKARGRRPAAGCCLPEALRLCRRARIWGSRHADHRTFTLPEVKVGAGVRRRDRCLRGQKLTCCYASERGRWSHFRLESTSRQLAFGIEKDLRCAGFAKGVQFRLVAGSARYREAAGSCVIVVTTSPAAARPTLGRGCRLLVIGCAMAV